MKIVALSLLFLATTSCSLFSDKDENGQPGLLAAVGLEKKVEEPKNLIKKKILVPRFVNKSRYGGDEIGTLGNMKLEQVLGPYPEFVLVKEEELEGQEKFVDDFGEFNVHGLLQKARAHGISGVLLGTVTDLSIRQSGDEIGLFRMREFAITATVKLELWDANTERAVFSKLHSADVSEEHTELFNSRTVSSYDAERGKVAVAKALDKALASLPEYARKLAWTGRIAKIDIHRYYVNAGEMTGIMRGQLLKVFDDGTPVYDPDSKNFLGVAPGRFKGLLKVIDFFGTDGAVAIVHSGGNFREKDRVEIFTSLQK